MLQSPRLSVATVSFHHPPPPHIAQSSNHHGSSTSTRRHVHSTMERADTENDQIETKGTILIQQDSQVESVEAKKFLETIADYSEFCKWILEFKKYTEKSKNKIMYSERVNLTDETRTPLQRATRKQRLHDKWRSTPRDLDGPKKIDDHYLA